MYNAKYTKHYRQLQYYLTQEMRLHFSLIYF